MENQKSDEAPVKPGDVIYKEVRHIAKTIYPVIVFVAFSGFIALTIAAIVNDVSLYTLSDVLYRTVKSVLGTVF